MMDLFQKFKHMNIDGRLIALEYADITSPYFCYPIDAIIIGFEGSILYCFLPQYGDMVFASNPDSCATKYVYPLAANFEDFLRLIVSCGSANPVEQIAWMTKQQFEEHLQIEREQQTVQHKELLMKLAHELKLEPMVNPFEYVKALQTNFDESKIQFSEEYYDVLGIEKSSANHTVEFEPILFELEK